MNTMFVSSLKKILSLLFYTVILSSNYGEMITIIEENDVFTKSDTEYTQGLSLKYSPDSTTSFGIQQLMYTPEIITIPENQPYDRPYAGLLLFSYERLLETRQLDLFDITPSLTLYVGASGAYSLSDKTQTEFHRWINDDLPLGWDNQIANEPIINLTLKYRFDLTEHGTLPLFTDYIYGEYGADIGNAFIRSFIKCGIRYGFGNIKKTSGNIITLKSVEPKNGIFIFGEVIGYAVLHDITLHGSLFQSNVESYIDPELFVGEYRYGTGIYLFKTVSVLTGVAYRSKEFSDGGIVEYGFLELSVEY